MSCKILQWSFNGKIADYSFTYGDPYKQLRRYTDALISHGSLSTRTCPDVPKRIVKAFKYSRIPAYNLKESLDFYIMSNAEIVNTLMCRGQDPSASKGILTRKQVIQTVKALKNTVDFKTPAKPAIIEFPETKIIIEESVRIQKTKKPIILKDILFKAMIAKKFETCPLTDEQNCILFEIFNME